MISAMSSRFMARAACSVSPERTPKTGGSRPRQFAAAGEVAGAHVNAFCRRVSGRANGAAHSSFRAGSDGPHPPSHAALRPCHRHERKYLSVKPLGSRLNPVNSLGPVRPTRNSPETRGTTGTSGQVSLEPGPPGGTSASRPPCAPPARPCRPCWAETTSIVLSIFTSLLQQAFAAKVNIQGAVLCPVRDEPITIIVALSGA